MSGADPGTRRPLTARGAATRARIVDAAAGLMYWRGVGGTSLDDVRAASATSKSQLYHYFADKDDLVLAVIARQSERVLSAQRRLLHQCDSLAGLRRWRDVIVEMNGARRGVGGCPLGSLASELAEYSEVARALLAESFHTWEALLAGVLTTMRERGELDPDADPDVLAASILAALQGGLLLAQTTRDTQALERSLDMAVEYVAHRHTGS